MVVTLTRSIIRNFQAVPQLPLHSDKSESGGSLTYRVRGIPSSVGVVALQEGLKVIFETQNLHVDSLAPSSTRRQGQVATIRVSHSAKLPDTQDEWRVPAGSILAANADDKTARMLAVDTHFHGFTPLYSPASDTEPSLE